MRVTHKPSATSAPASLLFQNFPVLPFLQLQVAPLGAFLIHAMAKFELQLESTSCQVRGMVQGKIVDYNSATSHAELQVGTFVDVNVPLAAKMPWFSVVLSSFTMFISLARLAATSVMAA